MAERMKLNPQKILTQYYNILNLINTNKNWKEFIEIRK